MNAIRQITPGEIYQTEAMKAAMGRLCAPKSYFDEPEADLVETANKLSQYRDHLATAAKLITGVWAGVQSLPIEDAADTVSDALRNPIDDVLGYLQNAISDIEGTLERVSEALPYDADYEHQRIEIDMRQI